MELWSSGGVLQALPQKRYGDLDASRRCRDMEEFVSRSLEMRCRRVDVEMFASRALEL